jgi:diguanylate cyclase (GGDEF)-like protein/PAS domain S-box-containing protein
MFSIKKPLKLRLSSKLLLMNLATGLVIVIISCVVAFSFLSVRNKSIDVMSKGMERVVANSQATRELAALFADIDLFTRRFYGDVDYVKSEGNRLRDLISRFPHHGSSSDLDGSLLILSEKFDDFLSQCQAVNKVLNARELIDREVHEELTRLESLMSELLIDATLAGEDTSFITQELALVMGYRESLLYIAKLYAELGFELHSVPVVEKTIPVVEVIDDLLLRLQTITASIPEVAWHGERIRNYVKEYKQIVLNFFVEMEKLSTQRDLVVQSKSQSLAAMESVDKRVAMTAGLAARSIGDIVLSSGVFVLILTVIIVVVLFVVTANLIRFHIKNPMQAILSGIGSFRKGDLSTQIELNREDEWNTIREALNSMAVDLNRSYTALQQANDELEKRVEERTKELGQSVEALSHSQSMLVEAQRIAHLGHWSWDIETGDNEWSEEQFRIFGYEPFEIDATYDLFLSHLHPADRERVLEIVFKSLERNLHFSVEFRIVRRDGSQRWIEGQGRPFGIGSDGPTGMLGTALDTTERKRIENLLLEEKERALVTLHSIGDAVISTDSEGRVEYLNPVAEKLTEYSVDEARGQPLERVFHIINEETREEAEDPASRCLREGKVIGLANHTVLVNKLGIEYAVQDSAAPIKGQEGEVLGVVLVFSDVTQSRQLTRQISYQASHDGLTGLINRREFEQRLKRVLETARSASTENALCYLDLDQFKLVNDTCGHVAGDELLRQVGKLLQDNVRHRDTVARLGGDEFGLLMEHCSLIESEQVAEKLVRVISEHKFLWENRHFSVGVSIGLVAVNETSADMNGLLSAADTACYMAKDRGRNRIHVYQEDDEEIAKRHGEMQWAIRLPRAVEEGRFRLYFQPMMSVAGGHDEGAHYEVLLRMNGEHIVLPKIFFAAADRYNLSSRLDRWVISTTFGWIVDHPDHLESLYLCAINLSGHSLNDETFLEFVRRQFAEFPIPPEKICFEITETVAISNLTRVAEFMKSLKAQGCKFSLDDFGSGLSSFAYLKSLPVDFLKIDGAFVKDILSDSLDLAMVRSINEIGQVMGKQTIAEFVESEAILDKLREIGVDYAQGYGIKRPRPIEEILH